MTEWNDQVPTASDILANSQAYKDLMNTMQNMINSFNANQGNQGTEVHPTTDELDQFHKSWFYNNWSVRFRRLMSFTPLGTRGVIAIPNTTFEEWLWWFHEWMQAFMEDYNAFKKLVLEAIQAIEKHLELIDKEIDDIEKHLQEIDKEISDIEKHLQKIDKEISDIDKHLQNIDQEINEINQKISNLQNQINNLNNKVDNNYNNVNNQIKNIKNEIDALKFDLKPSYMNINADNEGAQNGWHTNDQAKPNQFHIEYRWANNNDHTQGLYMRFACNRVYNDNYNPASDSNGHLLMSVDLTNFINETHAQLPHAPGAYGWVDGVGSYWNNQQRAGLQYQFQMNGNTMNIYISSLYGVASMTGPGRYETEGGSIEWYIPTA